MKILLVAFEFPPLGGAGVQRSMAWARYLHEHGVHPTVVTTDETSFRATIGGPIDQSLMAEIPGDLPVERIPCPRGWSGDGGRFAEWRRIFFARSDALARWWRPSVERALPDIIERHRPEAVLVSLPPFSMGPLWADLARRHNLPLVLDFRDAWSQWVVSPYASPVHYALVRQLEGECLRAAQHVVCTTEETRLDFLRVHPDIPPERLVTITNGYTADVSDWSLLPADRNDDLFVIGYVGQFYYNPAARAAMMRPALRKPPHRMIQYAPRKEDWLYRSPLFFFRAVQRLLEHRPELRDRVRVRFAGTRPAWIDGQVEECGLEDVVEFVGYLDHTQVIRFQQSCDCLLVTSSKVLGGRDYSIAGKTFEYFTIHKPILGFVCEGAQKDLLARSGVAVLCDPDDPSQSAERLAALIDGRTHLTPNVPFLQSLHRRRLADAMSRVLEEAAAGGASTDAERAS